MPETAEIGPVLTPTPAAVANRSPLLKRISWIDYSLFAGVVTTHAADWATTEQCSRTSQEQEKAGFVGLCREAFLPTALVESKVGFGAYQAPRLDWKSIPSTC